MVLFQLAKFVFWRLLRSTAVQTRAAPSNSLGTLETRSIKSATLVSHQCAEWETLTQRLTKHLVRQFASIIIASDEGFPHRKFRLFGWKHDIEIGKAQHFANTTQLPPFFFCVCVSTRSLFWPNSKACMAKTPSTKTMGIWQLWSSWRWRFCDLTRKMGSSSNLQSFNINQHAWIVTTSSSLTVPSFLVKGLT